MIARTLRTALGVAFLLAGCGGGAGPAGAAQDASADVAATCTTLVPDGALTVSDALMPMSPPPDPPAGGTIANGLYFRTASLFYVESTCTLLPGAPSAMAVRFTAASATAGVIDVAQVVSVPGEQHLAASSFSYTIAGTTMTRTLRCATLDGADATTSDGGAHVGDVSSASYTAVPTGLRLYVPLPAVDPAAGSCGTGLTVFQKQQVAGGPVERGLSAGRRGRSVRSPTAAPSSSASTSARRRRRPAGRTC
ncbi:MAG TPA: hypothetical protein VIF57_30350 [Polyangia bacterium]|jgi:hypothetical protein